MKKRASTHFLMWVMVTVIWLHAHLSIAAVSKSNGTTSVCDGSVEDCFIVDHLDSQLPTISSSHFRRILATGNKFATSLTNNPDKPSACKNLIGQYHKCGAEADPGTDSRCAQAPYLRICHKL